MASRPTVAQPVSVFGSDASGKPFFQAVRVVSIDGFEVTVAGVQRTLEVNDVVGVRHGEAKARFQVAWVGRAGTPQQGQVGLRALELQKDIFGQAVQGPVPGQTRTDDRERRRQPRIACHGTVQFHRQGASETESGALRLLSEGGCYIETKTPVPPPSRLDLTMMVDGLELRAAGEVRAADQGFGMGVAFDEMNPAHRTRLRRWTVQHCKGVS